MEAPSMNRDLLALATGDPALLRTVAGDMVRLSTHGDILVCCDGRDLLAQMQRRSIALLIIGPGLPNRDETQLAVDIKLLSPATYVVLIVASLTTDVAQYAREYGIDRCLPMPVPRADLAAIITMMMG